MLRWAQNIEGFLSRLRQSAENLEVTEQQKILRSIVKEILVGSDVVTIKRSIPVGDGTLSEPIRQVICWVRGVISPLSSNIYLREVLDPWFVGDVLPRLHGRSFMVRSADDARSKSTKALSEGASNNEA